MVELTRWGSEIMDMNKWCSGLVCFLAALVLLAMCPWEAQAEPAGTSGEITVVFFEDGIADWKDARRVLEARGGYVRHVLPPSVFIGDFSECDLEALADPPLLANGERAWSPQSVRIVRGAAEAQSALKTAESGACGVEKNREYLAALRFLLPSVPRDPRENPTLRVKPNGTVELLPPEAWETPPLIPKDLLPGYKMPEGIGNTWYNTSDYLCGDVVVAICRPESNGNVDTNTENWTDGTGGSFDEITYTLTELMKAMGQLQNDAPRGKLTFVYRTEHVGSGVTGTVDCDYEAITHPNWTSTVVLNVLGKLGYSSAADWERMHEWVNARRTLYGTDWAVGFFIVDESTVGAGTGGASAYINGPAVWIFSTNDYKVYHHESGHTWGAWDEYASALDSPTSFGGYTQDVNANSEYNDGTGFFAGAGEGINALMMSNVDYVSPWTRGQIGIWDLDGDGVYEPLDVKPGVSISAPSGSTWGPLQFTGQAWGGSLIVESGSFTSTDVTLGRITKVEWRMNGGPWDNAFPIDGAFNSSSEWYTFASPPLRNWGHVFEVRATDNFGNVTTQFARYDYTATGSPLTNMGPMAAASVTPRYGSTGTTFTFDATGSWDLEDGTTGLQVQWDFDGDLIWDAFTPVATHSYPAPGTYTPRVAVTDRMGFVMSRPIQNIQVAASDVPPVATFTVDAGLKFISPPGYPVLFNFDATGVWDGEDAASSLQVRWDWEDDGVWDTTWSTTKTVVKDYSWDYAVNPGQESGNTYLYSGCSVNGFAQSFVAGTTLIGKAELFLSLNGACGTPGGTITVGLRSSLTGSWLTSVTVSQSALNLGDWNLFDFVPDAAVSAGTTYYLVAITSDKDLFWLADNTNPYASGQHYYSSNGGTSWSTNASYDHTFRIYDGNLGVVPLTKSKVWRVRMEVKDSSVNAPVPYLHHVCANGYDNPPSLTLSSDVYSGTPLTTFNLTASGSDPDFGTVWDGMLDYRWDQDGDGNYETEFAPVKSHATNLFPRAGIYQATCEVRDRYHATAKASVTLNVAPSAGGMGLTDRNGSLPPGNTDEREVDVSFATSGEPQEVILSENSSFAGASWQSFGQQLVHKLSASSGGKTLYAKFRSGVGNESGSLFASITYTPASPSLTVTKNGSDARLTWSPTGAFDYSVYRSNNKDYSSYTQFTASPTTMTTLDHLGALSDGQLWFYKVETDPFP